MTRSSQIFLIVFMVFAGCDSSGGSDGGAVGSDAGPPSSSDAGTPGTDAGGDDGGVNDDAGPGDSDAGAIEDPGAAGSFTAEMASDSIAGSSGSIPLTIYLPTGAGPSPVVVFHHGFQLGPSDYASYGQHLASWGYVAVFPQMPGGLLGGPTHTELGADVIAILDWVDAGAEPIAGRVDASQIALAGHSLGGKISFLVASMDARVDAVVGLDPVDAGGGPFGGNPADFPSVAPDLMSSVSAPFVVVGETTSGTCTGFGCMPCAPTDENFQRYFEAAASPALEVDVLGAAHMSFLDDPNCGLTCSVCGAGSDDPAVTRTIARRTMTAFLEVTLRGRTGFSTYLTGPEIMAEVTAGRVATRTANGF